MDSAVQASVSGFFFAAIGVGLLLGVFFGRPVSKSLRTWWRSLDLNPWGKRGIPEVSLRSKSKSAARDEKAPHQSPPHVEKKEAHTHRKG